MCGQPTIDLVMNIIELYDLYYKAGLKTGPDAGGFPCSMTMPRIALNLYRVIDPEIWT